MPRPQIVIENPILNTPFAEPERHFRFDDEGITDDVVEGRRPSSYFMPIPKAKKKGGQLVFDEWTGDRIEETGLSNQIRERIARWRELGWPSATPTTRSLLEYWTNPERERPLFFCQVEALETAIYLTEAAKKLGDSWIENQLRTFAEDANPGLFRVALTARNERGLPRSTHIHAGSPEFSNCRIVVCDAPGCAGLVLDAGLGGGGARG